MENNTNEDEIMDRYQSTRKVALLGISANIFLVVIKLIIGFFSRSQAMIADGLNSAGDVFSSTITYIGNKISAQPNDMDHPYGHGKAEYIFSMVISFSLFIVAFQIFKSALSSVLHHEAFTFSIWLILVAASTIILKLLLFIYCKRVGRKLENLLILANAEDHRNDVFITLSTLLSIVLGYYQIYWVDGFVGIGISIWIAYTGGKIFMSAYNVLMDTNIDPDIEKKIIEKIQKIESVDHVDSITAKPVGLHFILIVKLSVDKNLTVYIGHGIAAQVKAMLMETKDIHDVIVHVNPTD